MSLKHAILGFLSYRSLSGYDLKKAFDQSVQHFWPADQSQIYRTLKQLHEEGLITREVIPREERLDVKVYETSEAGRQELLDWLSTPLPPAETREPFLIQIYFAFMLADAQASQLVQAEIDQVDDLLALYAKVYDTVTERDQAADERRAIFYSMLTLEFGVKANRWYRDWLQSVKERIEAGDMTIPPLKQLLDKENEQETTS